MPVDVAALADMSGVDKNILTLFTKGTDGYAEDRIVDEVFSLKEVVDVLGSEHVMERLKKMVPRTPHDEVVTTLCVEKDSFLHHAASASHEEHRRGSSGEVKPKSTATAKDSGKEREKEAEKAKEKEKDSGFLKWIFKGKKKEHSHTSSPHPASDDAAPDVPPVTVHIQTGAQEPEHAHRDPSTHNDKHHSSSAHEADHQHTRKEKKTNEKKAHEAALPPEPAPGSITQRVMQVETEMNRRYNFMSEPSSAEVEPSASRRQGGGGTDDEFQAIFNQFLSNS